MTKKWRRRWIWAGGSLAALGLLGCVRYNIPYAECAPLASAQESLGFKGNASPPLEVPPAIIAHRGYGLPATGGKQIIGNTLHAIEKGIEAGADWIELDIRQSSDGILVLFHDPSIDAKTNGSGQLAKLSLAQLQQVELRVTEGDRTIPTLAEAIPLVQRSQAGLILDLKASGMEAALSRQLEASGIGKDRLILFGRSSILEAYRDGKWQLGYTALFRENANWLTFPLGLSRIMTRCTALGPNCRHLILPSTFLKPSLIGQARSQGYEVWSYGSDDPRDWSAAMNAGVSGLIVDDVAAAVASTKEP